MIRDPLTPLEVKAVFLFAEVGLDMPCPRLERDPALSEAARTGILKLQARSQLGREVS